MPDIKYPSPTLKYDPQSRLVIFQVLNPDTGDVVRQYPSQRVVKLYQDGSDLADTALTPPIPGVDPNAGKAKPATSGSSRSDSSKAASHGEEGEGAAPITGNTQAAEEPKSPSVKIVA